MVNNINKRQIIASQDNVAIPYLYKKDGYCLGNCVSKKSPPLKPQINNLVLPLLHSMYFYMAYHYS